MRRRRPAGVVEQTGACQRDNRRFSESFLSTPPIAKPCTFAGSSPTSGGARHDALMPAIARLVSFQAQEEKVTTIPQPVHRRSSLMENLESAIGAALLICPISYVMITGVLSTDTCTGGGFLSLCPRISMAEIEAPFAPPEPVEVSDPAPHIDV